MGVFEDERGISNLMATLILIAVAVVGGAFAYTAFRDQAQTTTSEADLQVQSLDAQSVGENGYCSTTIKNVGTQRLGVDDGVTVTVIGDGDNVALDVGELDPGQTGSDSTTYTDGNLNAGETYPVRIEADTPDGGSITKTMTVRVQS